MIKNITTDDLRRMSDREGLVLQGCGGDPQEWLEGINELLTKEGILPDGGTFKEASVFERDGVANLLFGLERVKLDWSKLAAWRLTSHKTFGGTWLSDYVPNRLGDFIIENEKPDCPIIGADGNIFNIMGIAARTLKDHGLRDEAKEMRERVTASGSYDNALVIIMEYVNPVSADGYMDEYCEDETEDFGGMTMN